MIYLVWWSPRCWKSTLSDWLKEVHKIPCIHLDEIASAYFESLTLSEQRRLYPLFSLEDWNTARFDQYSIEDNIRLELEEWQNLSEIILKIIRYNIFSFDNYIIEWVQLTPGIVKKIIDSNPDREFKTTFLVREDASLIFRGIKKYMNNGWDCRMKGIPDSYLELYSIYISWLSKRIISEWRDHNFTCENTERDFNSRILNIIDNL